VEYLGIAMPVVLGFMGVVASLSATTRAQRTAWTIGFAVAGVIAVLAGVLDRKQMRVENLGGDQFFAVSFLFTAGMDPKGKFPLAVSNSGDTAIYDAAFVITKEGDFPQNGLEVSIGTIYPREILRRVSAALPVGSYTVDIRSRAGGWFFEKLNLVVSGDNLHQSYYVRRVGSDEKLINVP
jgi:hypothetical protein